MTWSADEGEDEEVHEVKDEEGVVEEGKCGAVPELSRPQDERDG